MAETHRNNSGSKQAQHLKDHLRFVERHIEEIDAETQQYLSENARLRGLVFVIGKIVKETGLLNECLSNDMNSSQNHASSLGSETT